MSPQKPPVQRPRTKKTPAQAAGEALRLAGKDEAYIAEVVGAMETYARPVTEFVVQTDHASNLRVFSPVVKAIWPALVDGHAHEFVATVTRHRNGTASLTLAPVVITP
jgi:hypothetical protein